jgi:diguanylate cyclase (GGDEF)-like protein
VIAALALSLFLGIFTLFYGRNEKKNYFVLTMFFTSVFLTGHLLELLSGSRDEAAVALKVLYIGAPFVSAVTVFFIADYCNVKLHKIFVKSPMLLISMAITAAMWTNEGRRLIYADYWFDGGAIHYLRFAPGPLYYAVHMYPVVCLGVCSAIIIRSLRKRDGRENVRNLIVLFLSTAGSFIAESVYFLSGALRLDAYDVYFTPYILALTGLILFVGILRFHMFDLIPEAAAMALDAIAEAYILIDADGNYLAANPAAMRLFPGLTSAGKGSDVRDVNNWPKELYAIDIDKGTYSVDYSGHQPISGQLPNQEEIRYYRAAVNPVKSNQKKPSACAILIQDVTDSVRMMNKLEIAAFTDPLTGLYNRRYFTETAKAYIEKAARQDEPYFVMMLDLDSFKEVNDTFGHQTGDKVLQHVASVVKHIIRPYDLFARYGGEEFVLLVMEVDENVAMQLAERIRGAIENMELDDPANAACKTTCSIGVAKSAVNASLEEASEKADKALYRAKRAGRNRVHGHMPGCTANTG